jgi:hypothetical protein
MSKYYKMSGNEPDSSDEEGKRKLDEWAERQCKIWTNVQENRFKRKQAEIDRLAEKERKENERIEKEKEKEAKKQKEKEPKRKS